LPPTGEPPPAYASSLVQRNNETFKDFNSQGAGRGKTVIARSTSARKILIVHQPERSKGITLEDLRDKLFDVGVDDAIFLDGGDSAMLWAGTWYFKPAARKNNTNTIGVGFSLPR
jgi:hypothetical protein